MGVASDIIYRKRFEEFALFIGIDTYQIFHILDPRVSYLEVDFWNFLICSLRIPQKHIMLSTTRLPCSMHEQY
jgi:hypothetical protein